MNQIDIDNMPRTELQMSNFDNSIDEGLEEKLKDGYWCNHNAWNYNGTVWYKEGHYYEAVYHYRRYQSTYSAKTLRELMDIVQDQFGTE